MKISKEFLEKSRKNFSSDRGNLIAQRASVNNGIMKAAFNRFEDDTNRHTFNIEPVSYTHLTLPTTPYV